MVIDAHAHIATADIERYPTGPVGGHDVQPELLDHPFDAEQLISAMDDEGIAVGIVVQRSHIYGYDNSYVSDSAESHSDRLSAVVSVDATASDVTKSIDYWVKERGARGIRLGYPGRLAPDAVDDTSWFSSDAAMAAWHRADELAIPVCIHFTRLHRTPGIQALGRVVRLVPNVSVVVDHLGNCAVDSGGPDYGMAELDPVDQPNVSFKIVPINFKFLRQSGLDPVDFIRRAADRFGSERLMYGTDVTNSPGSHQELLAAGVAATAGLSETERDDFLGGTVARVYGLSLVS